MSAVGPSARERLAQLFAKVDAFFVSAERAFPGADGITCHAGCDDCCQRRFSVTALEAEGMAEALDALPEEARRALAERAANPSGPCALLHEDGRCAAYEARPLICRTHGLPIRFAGEARHLPVVQPVSIDACPRNFSGRDLDALPREHVLDQGTLSTILGALDAARSGELGAVRRDRVEISSLLQRPRR